MKLYKLRAQAQTVISGVDKHYFVRDVNMYAIQKKITVQREGRILLEGEDDFGVITPGYFLPLYETARRNH